MGASDGEVFGVCVVTLFICYLSILFSISEWRARKYVELSALADDRWLCRKVAEALEIDADGEDAGSYVADAIRLIAARGTK